VTLELRVQFPLSGQGGIMVIDTKKIAEGDGGIKNPRQGVPSKNKIKKKGRKK